MRFFYARVSTVDQNLERQLNMAEEQQVDEVITDKQTGKTREREGLMQLLGKVREGDVVIVESISRLGRKTLDILEIVKEIEAKGAVFVSLKENMDTSTATGKAMFQMMCVIAELEHSLIVERTAEGMAAAKRRGVKVGRPRRSKEDIEFALRLYDSQEYSIAEIVRRTGISQSALYKYLKERDAKRFQEQQK